MVFHKTKCLWSEMLICKTMSTSTDFSHSQSLFPECLPVEGGTLSTETGMTFRTAKSQSLDSIFSSHQVITLLDNAEANEGFAPRAFPRFYQL